MKLRITLKSPLLIGGYSSSNPFADKSTARTEDGVPVIPASVVKGAIRIEFERLFSPNCTHADDLEKCDACGIFGRREDHPGLIVFSDAVLAGDRDMFTVAEKEGKDEKYLPTGDGYSARPGVVINRKTRTSEEKKLFFFETTEHLNPDAPLIFESDLSISPELERNSRLMDSFRASIRAVFAIGGSKSRGMGVCEFELLESPDDKKRDQAGISLQGPVIDMSLRLRGRRLTIGANKPYQHFVETLDYIPGSSVRGALAKAIAQRSRKTAQAKDRPKGQAVSERLRQFFTDSGAIFGDSLHSEGFVPSHIIPSSARACKINGGFIADSTPNDQFHGVVDSVIDDLAWNEDLPIPHSPSCPHRECGHDLSPVTGYYRITTDSKYIKVNMQKHVVTRTALDRKLRNSRHGQLFSIESIEKPARTEKEFSFAGTIRNVPDSLLDELAECDGKTLRIGAEASTGHGEIVLNLKSGREPGPSGIGERITAFNSKLRRRFHMLRERWGSLYGVEGRDETSLYFTADMLSHVILFDDDGLYKGVLDDAILQKQTGITARLVRSYARTEPVSGWFFKQSAGGESRQMPKRVQPAISRGSVFVYRIDDMPEPSNALLAALCGLESNGIGERREEGYGHIRICDEFHYSREVY